MTISGASLAFDAHSPLVTTLPPPPLLDPRRSPPVSRSVRRREGEGGDGTYFDTGSGCKPLGEEGDRVLGRGLGPGEKNAPSPTLPYIFGVGG